MSCALCNTTNMYPTHCPTEIHSIYHFHYYYNNTHGAYYTLRCSGVYPILHFKFHSLNCPEYIENINSSTFLLLIVRAASEYVPRSRSNNKSVTYIFYECYSMWPHHPLYRWKYGGWAERDESEVKITNTFLVMSVFFFLFSHRTRCIVGRWRSTSVVCVVYAPHIAISCVYNAPIILLPLIPT